MTTEEESSSDVEQSAPDSPAAEQRSSAARRAATGAGVLIRACRMQWRSILVIALAIAAVGLATGLFVFQYRPDRRLDAAAAEQAVRAASDGATAVLSYSSDSLDRDIAAAKDHLTGDFLTYYTKFTTEVVTPVVRGKHLVQKADVIRAAVSQLSPASAVVLEFVNETVTGEDKNAPSTTATAIRVTLRMVDGTWLISKLDPLA